MTSLLKPVIMGGFECTAKEIKHRLGKVCCTCGSCLVCYCLIGFLKDKTHVYMLFT